MRVCWRTQSGGSNFARGLKMVVNACVKRLAHKQMRISVALRPSPTRHMLRLFTLGELRLETVDGLVVSRRRKPLILLAYLARRAPRSVPRTELTTLLWGEKAEEKARQSLRQALLDLKQLVGNCIEITHDTVQIERDVVELDIARFERDIEDGRDREAVARWAGEFLYGADSVAEMALGLWLQTERAGLHRRLAFAFERILDGAERRGGWDDAVVVARRWTELSPLDERACTHLIRALRRDGHAVDALACHASFLAHMKEEGEAPPSRSFMVMAHSLDEPVLASQHNVGGVAELKPSVKLVGRESAFLALASAWQASRGGRAAVIVIEAEHGMGSTRLCSEFVRWLKEADTSTLVLRSASTGHPQPSVPYAYITSILASMCSAPALGGLSEGALTALAQLLPRLRERFTHIPSPTVELLPADMAASLREALDGIAEDSPVVIIAEAVDDADAESRTLLAQLASGERPAVLYVLVARSDAADGDQALVALRASASTLFVPLAPISAEDIAEMLSSVSQIAGDDRTRLARAILEDTGGIPAYAVSLIEALIEERLLTPGRTRSDSGLTLPYNFQLPTPARMGALLQARMRLLDTDARRVLEAVAVYDAPFTTRDVEEFAGLAPHSARHSATLAVEALLNAKLIRRIASGVSYELAPPIVARSLYALIPALQCEIFHAAAGNLVRNRAGRWQRLPADRARLRYHVLRSGAAIRNRRAVSLWRAGIAVAVICVIALASRALWWKAPVARDRAVVVFPFSVTGGAQFDFLRNGMVDLLSTSLDGAAGLRTVDPRAVIAASGSMPAGVLLTPDEARKIAARFDASYFVMGSVIASGGSLQVSATLYDMRAGRRGITRTSAAGSEAALFSLVDRLTAQLAVAQGAGSGERLTQLAAVTTSSLDALKAYLEGRNAYRANDLLAALPAFERAVAADSSFALAWYGLASTASWMLRPKLERSAAAQAVLHQERLSERDRTLVQAFAAYSRGSADTAERLTGSIVEAYDGDVEAWALLGEILFHHNWKRGRSLIESRRAWEHVLALDPNYWPALQHLSEVAALEGHPREADSLLAHYEHSVGSEHMPITSRAFRAYAFGDSASRDEIAIRLATDRGFWLTLSVNYVAVFAQDVDGARRLARFLVDPVRPPDQQGFGRILLAHLALAQGKWHEARAEFAIARAHSPEDALEAQLLLSMAPFLSTADSDIGRQSAELRVLPAAASDAGSAMPWPYPVAGMHPLVRSYVTGIASARRGNDVGSEVALAELAKLPDPMSLSRGFAATIRAEQRRIGKHPSAALLELERGMLATPFVESWTSGFVSQAYERYVRAELLHHLGRDDEALRWYGTFGENSPYDLVYLAPAAYRAGQIYEARGQKAQAARRYTQFLRLWKNADPELRSVTDDARVRLARLRRSANGASEFRATLTQ